MCRKKTLYNIVYRSLVHTVGAVVTYLTLLYFECLQSLQLKNNNSFEFLKKSVGSLLSVNGLSRMTCL